jgi:hypothetical protein
MTVEDLQSPDFEHDFVEYEVVVDFSPGTEDPARIFESMSSLIHAFSQLDEHLASSVAAEIRPKAVLQAVEIGSLRTKLRVFLESIDDEALKELSWKKLVGGYLLKAKKRIVRWLGEKESIDDRSQLEDLQQELRQLAEETSVRWIPVYEVIPIRVLLLDIVALRDAVAPLTEGDSAAFGVGTEEIAINRQFTVSDEQIEDLLVDRVVSDRRERVMQVKRPDYLGKSMWDLREQGHTVRAKISDESWLQSFQDRRELVRPGDYLRVILETRLGYDENKELVFQDYDVKEVKQVIPSRRLGQAELPPPSRNDDDV